MNGRNTRLYGPIEFSHKRVERGKFGNWDSQMVSARNGEKSDGLVKTTSESISIMEGKWNFSLPLSDLYRRLVKPLG